MIHIINIEFQVKTETHQTSSFTAQVNNMQDFKVFL